LFDRNYEVWDICLHMTRCPKCQLILDDSRFFKSKYHKSGLSTYCKDCDRVSHGRPAKRKWISRRSGLEWCKICGQRPRLSYHQYCHECKMEYQRRTRAKKWSGRHPDPESRRHANARAYATNLLWRGKIKRGPCVFCDGKSRDFHHYDYEDRTMNFDSVCRPCHVTVHQFIKSLLTICRLGRISLASALNGA
jgi:hypothetical protein